MAKVQWDIDFSGLIGKKLTFETVDGYVLSDVLRDVEWKEIQFQDQKLLYPVKLLGGEDLEVHLHNLKSIKLCK